MKIRLEFKLADCWIGVYWKTDTHIWHGEYVAEAKDIRVHTRYTHHVWICLIPTLPIHITWAHEEADLSRRINGKDRR